MSAISAAVARPSLGIPAEEFGDPFTRRLLLHGGSTTAQLEQRLGALLEVRVCEQHLLKGTRLVRRTELVLPGGLVVSRNLVTGQLPGDPSLAAAITGPQVPLGRAVAACGTGQRRELLWCALGDWDAPGSQGGQAVCRGYMLWLAAEEPLYVEEWFNPAVVPATLERAS
ncbi:hypothetical protein [Kitasatospora azatica]|uniref:hypothetical protein n=1 Tax=Kitasatospora azatica TaxID=58347 RepID=UPI000561371A|nr:hypothetical protein [Kitasatospora azatica]